MKTKNLIIIIACLVLAAFAFGASGAFRLVNSSADETALADSLVGILVTKEHLDFSDGEGEGAEYQEKYYAALVEDETRKEYVFENTDGICFMAPQVTEQIGSYRSSSVDDGISDAQLSFNSSDEGESIYLEGTVFVSTRANIKNFYFNPVYQTPTGEVYVLSGDGMFLGDTTEAGMSMSNEIKEEKSLSAGDSASSSETKVKITVCYTDEPEKISVLQFGEKNELISQTEYAPNNFPDTLKALPETRYIIVETAVLSKTQTKNISREIYQPKDEMLFAFYCNDNGICVKQSCEIDWNN